ncbi:MAG: peptidoglycan editing factor PgeF [Moraxellaceae bacterium]|nr:peptidoglycan editing factor PgeF [Moraxellaceae bacterium]MDP1775343.1 peptidoglycan editing factor PgeF [Moraxellaceae bacterium]
MLAKDSVIFPDWPAPVSVHALVTTRQGGVSVAPFNSLNLGDHVDDEPTAVRSNRERVQQLAQSLSPSTPLKPAVWLRQVHGVVVFDAGQNDLSEQSIPEADAATTAQFGQPVTVMTADCLPVFFTNRQGNQVAVAHAGWRGLCDGVLEATVACFAPSDELMAWLGPAIGPSAFEVGEDVRAAFVAVDASAVTAFNAIAAKPGHYLADIYALARLRLNNVGVTAVYGGNACTVTQSDEFFSFRRDGRTGRMVSLIWLAAE